MEMQQIQTGKSRGGRPSKFTQETREKIITALRANAYIETAAAYAGIEKDTFYRWLKMGARAKSGPYREFSDAIKQTMGEAEVRDLAVISKAANGYDVVKVKRVIGPKGDILSEETVSSREFSWQAAAWRLERKYPQKWGRRDHIEVGGDTENPVHIKAEVEVYSDPIRLAKLIAAFADVKLIPTSLLESLADEGEVIEVSGQSSD